MSERQVVMITGASAGVGRATAVAFARRGARIGLLARGLAGLMAAQRDVEAAGGEALVCRADVRGPMKSTRRPPSSSAGSAPSTCGSTTP